MQSLTVLARSQHWKLPPYEEMDWHYINMSWLAIGYAC